MYAVAHTVSRFIFEGTLHNDAEKKKLLRCSEKGPKCQHNEDDADVANERLVAIATAQQSCHMGET